MDCNSCPRLPEALWDEIFLSIDFDEWYLRPMSLICKQLLSVSNQLKKRLHISNRNARDLPKLLQRFPNIKHINLPFFVDPEKFFDDINQCGIRLESLDLSVMSKFPIERFQNLPLSSTGATLRSLKLNYVENQNSADNDLEIIAELLPNLEELHLFWGCKVTDTGVARFASKLKKLRKISFFHSCIITDLCINSLSESCVNLEEITLSECFLISSEGICYALRHFSNLKALVLQRMDRIREEETLSLARNLTTLDFIDMKVRDSLLFSIASANLPLKKFSLSKCKCYTFDGILVFLKAYRSVLEHFAIESPYIRPFKGEDVVFFSTLLWNVKIVKLNYCCQLSTTQLLTVVHNCRASDSLEIKAAHLSRDQVVSTELHKNAQIRSLNLSLSDNLTDECLEKLAAACPNLTELFVNSCKRISQKGISEITRNCANLRVIHMNCCLRITGLDFGIEDARLEVLEARGSGLYDDGLIQIAEKCPYLMVLDVSRCDLLTAVGLKEVVIKCKHLWKLGLSYKHYFGSDLESYIRSVKPWLVI